MASKDNLQFTHFDEHGNAIMVDVGKKPDSNREAVASGKITMSAEAYRMVKEGAIAKGDVLGVARIAGVMAAKKVDQLIPLTHPLAISKVQIDFCLDDASNTIEVIGIVGVTGKTGVEMEALTAVSVAALTIYDMCKAVDKAMVINQICLRKKTGGKSGTYVRPEKA
jgi:cyclic pyranopterin phosphate synthase